MTSQRRNRLQGKPGMATWMKALLLVGYCLFLMFAIVLVSTAKSPAPKRSRWHQRNPLFNPAAKPTDVTVDQVVSLKDVPVPQPMAAVVIGPIPGPGTDLNFLPLSSQIVKNHGALVRLGKALFWDMQVGSDGIQSCATCHFNAGADSRAKNQISPNLSDANFHANTAPNGSKLGGDNTFGDATMPYTANDPNTPNPPGPVEPPPAALDVPGLPQFAPNYSVTSGDFPLNDWFNPTELTPRGPGVTPQEEADNVARDTNDIVASQGVRFTQCNAPCTQPGSSVDSGTPLPDIWNTVTPGVLSSTGVVRRAMPRNAPTMINAILNFDNLWEGRASFIFNGVNGFGFRDRTSTLKYNLNGVPTSVFVRITNSSMASVAVGPPTSNIAMSFNGRTFPDIGKKMVSLRPLARQFVHPQDSALGHFSRAVLNPDGTLSGSRGLTVATYAQMIQAAFQNNWWNSTVIFAPVTNQVASLSPVIDEGTERAAGHASAQVLGRFLKVGVRSPNEFVLPANQYSQMELNFSLFFGLAVQAYEATLISDNTPFDKFMGALHPVRANHGNPIPPQPNALTSRQRLGLSVFMDDNANLGTHCADCHIPPVTTGHTVLDYQPDSQGVPSLTTGEAIEFMIMGDDGAEANYDHGMYNIGVRRSCITGIDPTTCPSHNEDKGRGATAPKTPAFLNPLTGTLVGIGSISRSANVVTVTTTTPNPLAAGNFVAIEGVTDPTFNGIFAVLSVSSSTQFTYSQTAANGSSSGGTATGPNQPFPLSLVELVALLNDTSCAAAVIPHVGCLPPDVARFVPNIPILSRRVTNGAFKAPNLRNIKFSGPYFHVGDSATLRQVVEFYTRGGNFPNSNLHDKTVDVDGIPPLMFPQFDPAAEQYIEALVDFLAEGLKDDRVAFEKAPFDHPQLIIPNGSPKSDSSKDTLINIPAIGSQGRATELPTFLGLDPQQP